MRIPRIPPTFKPRPLGADLVRILQAAEETRSGRQYLHWDKLRLLKPPEGLTPEDWWFGLKTLRSFNSKHLPLLDIVGQPFKFNLPDLVLEGLHELDQRLGGRMEMSDGTILNRETRDRFLVHSLVEEAITSSQLEGAATTRLVAKEMLRSGRRPRDRSEQMILNNFRAMQQVLEFKTQPMSVDILLELHRLLTVETLDDPSGVGRFRRPDEDIRVMDVENQVLHAPPPAGQLDGRIGAMIDFANGASPGFFVHPIVRAIILHFWLAYEHPFIDGNGRCARTLFYWSMLRQGAWLCEFLSISNIIKKAPAKYGRAFLYTETDDNDLTYFMVYHVQLLRQAVTNLETYIAERLRRIHDTERLIKSSAGFNYRQLALLNHALRHPDADYTIQGYKISNNITYQTARTDLYHLAKAGLLRETKVGKAFHYRPAKDIEQALTELR